MNLLAFDTSTDTLSIAVQRGDQVWSHQGPGGAKASIELIPAVRALLEQAGLSLGDVAAVVFSRGPGSFTGLRTACSVAQGLAFAANGGQGVPVLPVDTLLAVAEEARHSHGSTQVLAVLDARMNEVYSAYCVYADGVWTSDAEFGLCAPEALTVPAGATVAGNAQLPYGERLAPGALHVAALPTATALLRLAPALLAAGAAVPAQDALPRYIRDKVAQTTQERLDAKAAQAAQAAAAEIATGVSNTTPQ